MVVLLGLITGAPLEEPALPYLRPTLNERKRKRDREKSAKTLCRAFRNPLAFHRATARLSRLPCIPPSLPPTKGQFVDRPMDLIANQVGKFLPVNGQKRVRLRSFRSRHSRSNRGNAGQTRIDIRRRTIVHERVFSPSGAPAMIQRYLRSAVPRRADFLSHNVITRACAHLRGVVGIAFHPRKRRRRQCLRARIYVLCPPPLFPYREARSSDRKRSPSRLRNVDSVTRTISGPAEENGPIHRASISPDRSGIR